MWIGVIVLLLSGTPQGAVEVFDSKEACVREVTEVVKTVEAKNHPEISVLHATCEEIK